MLADHYKGFQEKEDELKQQLKEAFGQSVSHCWRSVGILPRIVRGEASLTCT